MKKIQCLEPQLTELPADANERVLAIVASILEHESSPGETKRGIPPNYAGGDPSLCNARTKSGRPCRALGLEPSGRCKWHGGMSTGPRTAEGKAASAGNLMTRKKLRNRVVMELKRLGYDPASHFAHVARTRVT